MAYERKELIKELNQELKKLSVTDLNEIKSPGDIIRGVFFTMMNQKFTPEEIMEVFEGVNISDEKMALIEEYDQGIKRG